MARSATVTVRLADAKPIRNLIETVHAAIGSLEHGDHLSTQRDVADELREALDAIERPEDCERDCFRHGGKLSCECEDQEGGVWQPGC